MAAELWHESKMLKLVASQIQARCSSALVRATQGFDNV